MSKVDIGDNLGCLLMLLVLVAAFVLLTIIR